MNGSWECYVKWNESVKKDKHCMIPFLWGTEKQTRLQNHEDRSKCSCCTGGRGEWGYCLMGIEF